MNKKTKMILLRIALIMMVTSTFFVIRQVSSKAGSITWYFKDSSFSNLGRITSTMTVDKLTLIATPDKYMQVKANKQTLKGDDFEYCFCLKGKGNTTYRSIKVPVNGNSCFEITLMSSGKEERSLIIADSNGKQLSEVKAGTSISLQTYDYYGQRGDVYLYSKKSGINIFKIQVDDLGNNALNNNGSNDNSFNENNSGDTSLQNNSNNNVNNSTDNNVNNNSNDITDNNNSNNNSDNSSSNNNSQTSSENVGKTITITETITVKANETYDGKGIKIIAQGMGDGGQDEGQDPIFRLEKGASLKNVIIGVPGCDGVHCYGDNTITNVVWEDIGEDALTVKGGESANAGTITINGGSAGHATDKMFQINAPCTFVVNNFKGYDMGKFIRQNGSTGFDVNIYINSCTLAKVNNCIFKTDITTTKLYYKDLTVTNCKKWWDVPNSSQIVK